MNLRKDHYRLSAAREGCSGVEVCRPRRGRGEGGGFSAKGTRAGRVGRWRRPAPWPRPGPGSVALLASSPRALPPPSPRPPAAARSAPAPSGGQAHSAEAPGFGTVSGGPTPAVRLSALSAEREDGGGRGSPDGPARPPPRPNSTCLGRAPTPASAGLGCPQAPGDGRGRSPWGTEPGASPRRLRPPHNPRGPLGPTGIGTITPRSGPGAASPGRPLRSSRGYPTCPSPPGMGGGFNVSDPVRPLAARGGA